MTRLAPSIGWNCRPRPDYGSLQRTGYLAGYSDGFHGYRYGAGYDNPPSTYRTGFDEGRADSRRETRA